MNNFFSTFSPKTQEILLSLWNGLTLEYMMKFFVLYFFGLWMFLIFWVARDISERTENSFLRILSLLSIILFTPLGVFLYLLIRPRKNIIEKGYKEIDENLEILSLIIEDKIQEKRRKSVHCPGCAESIEPDYVICPICQETLKPHCKNCMREIHENWKVCPYCKERLQKKKS